MSEAELSDHLSPGRGFQKAEQDAILERAYEAIAEYHGTLDQAMLDHVERNGLLTPFYRAILR